MKINVKASTMVLPAQDTPKHSLWCSNLDLLVSRYYVPTVYFYKPNGSDPNFFSTKVLKEALSNVLVPFYPVAGRPSKDSNGRFEINCNGEGVLFLEAESDVAIDSLGDFTPRPELRQLVPTVNYSDDNASSHPLLLSQVTFFKCGGICLGVALHHTVADGIAAIHFINSWSDMARGLPIGIPPFIDRTALRRNNSPSPSFHHIEYDPSPSMITPIQSQEYQSSPSPTSTAMLTITLDQLNALKAKSKDGKGPINYSSYETLAAHVWRCVSMARDLRDDQLTKLYITTDGRSRLHPPLPNGFFGNVLFQTTPLALAGELRSQSLNQTVKNIHDALQRSNNDYLRSALDYIESQPDPMVLARGPHTFHCPNLNVISWTRLPVHDADFGWGRPVHMGPAVLLVEGKAYILPSPKMDGNFSMIICLQAQHMEVFKKLFYNF